MEERLLRYVPYYYGWFGGMGDYPEKDTLLAVIRTVLELGPDLKYPETDHDARRLLGKVREMTLAGSAPPPR